MTILKEIIARGRSYHCVHAPNIHMLCLRLQEASKQASKQTGGWAGRRAGRQEGKKVSKASEQVSRQESSQARKHLESIQLEPCPGGACFNMYATCSQYC